jgi:hypothetical protein
VTNGAKKSSYRCASRSIRDPNHSSLSSLYGSAYPKDRERFPKTLSHPLSFGRKVRAGSCIRSDRSLELSNRKGAINSGTRLRLRRHGMFLTNRKRPGHDSRTDRFQALWVPKNATIFAGCGCDASTAAWRLVCTVCTPPKSATCRMHTVCTIFAHLFQRSPA